MTYTVSQLAKLAGVTPRTLRHYDAVGLLQPSSRGKNGYRYYTQNDLLRLQQILFYRELDFSLEDIEKVLNSPSYSVLESLSKQKRMLQLKQSRLRTLIKTIDQTIKHMNDQTPIEGEDYYKGLNKEEIELYKEEAKARWGDSQVYKQSAQRVREFSKDDWKEIHAANEQVLQSLVELLHEKVSADDERVQEQIAKHFEGINKFYDCTLDMYQGLGELYLSDPRFKAYYEKFDPGLPEYLVEGMNRFVKTKKGH